MRKKLLVLMAARSIVVTEFLRTLLQHAEQSEEAAVILLGCASADARIEEGGDKFVNSVREFLYGFTQELEKRRELQAKLSALPETDKFLVDCVEALWDEGLRAYVKAIAEGVPGLFEAYFDHLLGEFE